MSATSGSFEDALLLLADRFRALGGRLGDLADTEGK